MANLLENFPAFLRAEVNEALSDDKSGDMKGYVYDGSDGSQIVLWDCPNGGVSARHVHDFDEYAIIVSGSYTGFAGDEKVILNPGDECFIPAGVWHEGTYSKNYRAIDGFANKRVKKKADM